MSMYLRNSLVCNCISRGVTSTKAASWALWQLLLLLLLLLFLLFGLLMLLLLLIWRKREASFAVFAVELAAAFKRYALPAQNVITSVAF